MTRKKILLYVFGLLLTFKCCFAATADETLETKFQDVLLVVHYNHPHYQSIPFIKEIYSAIFPNIVFYGEATYPEVNVVRTVTGFYFTPVVSHALKNYPGYRGYIFLQDDCLMNFWNYLRLDKDKIWFKVNGATENFHTAPLDATNSSWQFRWDWGLKALRQSFMNLSYDEWMCYQKNHGQNMAVGEMCDMFYIPGKFSSQAIALSDKFNNVFCEISIATMLSCIDSTYNWEKLESLWSLDCEVSFNNFSPELDWVHPLKFSQHKYREFVKSQIEKHYLKPAGEK